MVAFDYRLLDLTVAEEVRARADHIRKYIKQTLENIIEVGQALQAVKNALPPGKFGAWLRAEFGWGERMARNFMSVAISFGPQAARIVELQIQPTAAYLLAAPSVPDEARQTAIERAEAGEPVTAKVARDILTRTRKRIRRKARALTPVKLLSRLQTVVRQGKDRWGAKDIAELSRQLREFANELEAEHRDRLGDSSHGRDQ